MASTVEIRQAIIDWQGVAPSVTLNLLKTSSEGDVSAEMFTLNGNYAQQVADSLASSLLTKAGAKYPNRTVKLIDPQVAG